MLIEELHTNPTGEEGEAGGTYENGAGGGEEGAGGNYHSFQGDDGEEGDNADSVASHEPPTSIIVTNITLETFEQQVEREKFESLFHEIDETVNFQYFKSFRRVRVNFATAEQATIGRDKVHMTEFNGEVIKGYFTQIITIHSPSSWEAVEEETLTCSHQHGTNSSSSHHQPLPSGLGSPLREAEPIVNYDLISAVANLAPGEAHELHPPIEDKPGIIVHVCEECQVCDPQGEPDPGSLRLADHPLNVPFILIH